MFSNISMGINLLNVVNRNVKETSEFEKQRKCSIVQFPVVLPYQWLLNNSAMRHYECAI